MNIRDASWIRLKIAKIEYLKFDYFAVGSGFGYPYILEIRTWIQINYPDNIFMDNLS